MITPLLKHLQSRLAWKLFLSYITVVIVGIFTLTLATEAVIPAAFNRHMSQMEALMPMAGPDSGMRVLEHDLYQNYRTSVTEALLISSITAMVCAFLVSLFISRRVVTPIVALTEASQRIADGRYQERVSAPGQDELSQLANSFNQMAHTLAETESMRRNLIGDIAHELSTPLSSIKGYMEGLIDNVIPATDQTYHLVYHEADRLQGLVRDLQALSKVEAKAFTLNKRPLSLIELAKQSIDRLRPQFIEKKITLNLKHPHELPHIMGDEDRLGQVLLNLLGNALQYTPVGGAVTLTIWQDNNQIRLKVEDTGIGIPEESIVHIFTRFYRVDKSRSRAGGGSGIGLTIAKSLIERHEGQIWAESAGPNQGSSFHIALPLGDAGPHKQ